MSSLFDYLCVGNKVKNPYNNKKFKTNMLLRVEKFNNIEQNIKYNKKQ